MNTTHEARERQDDTMIDDAHAAAAAAHDAHVPHTDNPHPTGALRRAWEYGWDDACRQLRAASDVEYHRSWCGCAP